MKKIFAIFVLALVGLTIPAFANAQSTADDATYDIGPQVYQFHLHFADGKLTPIIKDVLPYDFISEQFIDSPGLYYGRVFSLQNQQIADFHFDLLEGDNNVLAPYFPDAKVVGFYRSNTDKDPMLAIQVSKTALCNDDKVCQTEAGENKNNCPLDCGGAVSANNSASNANLKGSPTVGLFNVLILVFIMLAVAIVAIFVIMYIKRNKN